jgi:hypothetical protein
LRTPGGGTGHDIAGAREHDPPLWSLADPSSRTSMETVNTLASKIESFEERVGSLRGYL